MCKYEDDVSLAEIYHYTAARAVVLPYGKVIRTYTSPSLRVHHQFRYDVPIITAVGTPAEDVDPAD